jgi:hypothetical protein
LSIRWIKVLFVVCGIYDGLLGAVFFSIPAELFSIAGVTPPNHFGYVEFPALLLVIFAAMFFRIAANPAARREQILYGMALKVSYFGLVFWYEVHGGIPMLWIPWAFADVIFFILFFWAWKSLRLQNDKHD